MPLEGIKGRKMWGRGASEKGGGKGKGRAGEEEREPF